MSWLIDKKGKKYRIWSTVSDSWLTDWQSRDEIIDAIAYRWRRDLTRKIREERKNFPAGWFSSYDRRMYPYPPTNTKHQDHDE